MARDSSLALALDGADFVLVDGAVFATEYLRLPDEDTRADDVVLEARHGDAEFSLTLGEFDAAEPLGDGVFRLKTGELLRLLSQPTVH
ncbi:MAG: hypothetical protein OEV46_04795 [Betaproteobacteria bacterium]|jgi:hypothetical protein|nr:hypothetical protein [Betaproteobacteria bacterium]MDH5288092.1 hypothetical protein [Betaproteobacteria bacterium]